jgi:hypothetical protein
MIPESSDVVERAALVGSRTFVITLVHIADIGYRPCRVVADFRLGA